MIDIDNQRPSYTSEPANEDNLTVEQEFELLYNREYPSIDEVAPYGSEDLYSYSDGYEH